MSVSFFRQLTYRSGGLVLLAAILSLATGKLRATTAYVPGNDGIIWMFDSNANALLGNIPLTNRAAEMVLTPDGKLAYVTEPETLSGLVGNTVEIVSTTSNTIVGSVTVGAAPRGIAITPDGKFVYVANSNWSSVWVIDTSSNTVSATITTGNGPYEMVMSPDGKSVYVTNVLSNSVSVIDVATNTVVKTIPVGSGPDNIAISPAGDVVYVSNYSGSSVSFIDSSTGTVTRTLTTQTQPRGVAVSRDGLSLYVAAGINSTGFSVSLYNTSTGATVTNIPETTTWPYAQLTMSPDGSNLYSINGGVINVISTATNTITATLSAGGASGAAVFAPLLNQQPSLNSVSVNPVIVPAETSTTGTVSLTAPAPAGGFTIDLWTAGSPAFVPTSVTVPAGLKSATFPVTTSYVVASADDTITAYYKGQTKTTTVTVTPVGVIAIASVTVAPGTVIGGASAIGTVTLSAPAPSGGTTVDLWTNGSPAFVSTSVTVPAGSKSANFGITTVSVSTSTQGVITAFFNGASKTTALTVTPATAIALSSVSVSPTSVVREQTATGTILLNTAAPSGGVTVYLWTNGSPAFVPSSVVVPAGSSSVTFAVTTNYVLQNTQGVITALYGGVSKATTVTVTP